MEYAGYLAQLAADTATLSTLLTSADLARQIEISCFHHQALDRLGAGLRATAWSVDGIIEATEMAAQQDQWFMGVQWHPEDTAATDPHQHAIFAELVRASADFGRRQ